MTEFKSELLSASKMLVSSLLSIMDDAMSEPRRTLVRPVRPVIFIGFRAFSEGAVSMLVSRLCEFDRSDLSNLLPKALLGTLSFG